MANPVLSTRGLFQPAPSQYVAPAQGLNGNVAPQPGAPSGYQPYVAPGQGYAPQGAGVQGSAAGQWQAPSVTADRMTIDDVLAKTAISLGMLVLVAAMAYIFLPAQILYPAGLIGGLVAFITPLIVAKSRTATPIGNVVYAIAEGLLIGAFSKIFEMYYPGIIVQAVLGTFVAAAVTLVAFHFGGFRLSSKASQMVRVGLFAFAGVALVNLVLMLFGVNTGMFPGPTGPVSGLAWVLAVVGIGLAVFSLVDDFQYIQAGVQAGAPRSQGWVAAFGLSVTMVWLYINILRLLSYIRR